MNGGLAATPAHGESVKANAHSEVSIRARIIEEVRGSLVEYSGVGFRDEGEELAMTLMARLSRSHHLFLIVLSTT